MGETRMQFEPRPLQHKHQLIGEGTRTVCSTRLTLLESEVKCLLFADDLVLLSPTKEGLQQHLDILHRFCHLGWALTVSLSKIKNNGVPKKVQLPGPQTQIPLQHISLPNHQHHR